MNQTTIRSLIRSAAKRASPPRKITASQWAEQYRYYSNDVSPNPGKHNNDRAPYQKFILDAWSDPDVEEITIISSAQIGKTSIVENGIGYQVKEDPCPMMMVHPRVEDAEDFSKDRLMAMVRDSPILHGIFGDERKKTSGSTILKKKFTGGFFKQGGSNAPASLASRSIRVIILEEKDRYEKSAGKEGDPSSLAKKRTNNFHNRKIINISTPTIKGYSAIEKDWLRSDQRDFYCQCPNCKERITLEFEQLKAINPEDIPGTTVYICQQCDAVIEESQRADLLSTMLPMNAKPFKGHMGFRINQLYSPWVPWYKTVNEYIESKDDPEKYKVFLNTALARLWEIKGEVLAWEVLYGRRENYQTGIVPAGGLFLTASADIQKNRIEVEIKAWGRGKQSWSIDHIVLPGMTRDDKVWNDLAEIVDNIYPHECGAELPIRLMAVDSGAFTDKAYDFVRRFPRSKVIPIKGGPSSMITMVNPPKTLDVSKGTGKKKKSGPRVWIIGGDLIKSEFFGNLAKEKPTDEELAGGAEYPSGYCHYPQYPEEFFKQLTAEVLVPRKGPGGTVILEYQKLTNDSRNEAIDLHVYNRAVANILGMDRFQEKHWAAMEAQLGIATKIKHGKSVPPGVNSTVQPVQKAKRKKNIIKGSGFISR